MKPHLTQLCGLVIEAAEHEIMPRYYHATAHTKADGSIATEADLGCQQWLSKSLEQEWSDIPLLGEEMTRIEQNRLLKTADKGLWILDPLDGTSNFAAGFPFFSISLALVLNGKVVMGVIYDPVRKECFCAERNKGAWRNDSQLKTPEFEAELKQCIALVDFKRLSTQLATTLAVKPPFRSQRNLGSVALDWCWMAAGQGQLYLHGGQSLWDYAAGQLIFEEAGGVLKNGAQEITLNKRPALAASTSGLLALWWEWIEDNDR